VGQSIPRINAILQLQRLEVRDTLLRRVVVGEVPEGIAYAEERAKNHSEDRQQK